MTVPQQWNDLIGCTVIDVDGDKLGKVGQIYLDDATGQAEWVTVSTGMFGSQETFAPLYNSSFSEDQLRLAVPKQLVKDAPNVENDGHLEVPEIDALYGHYAGYLGLEGQRDPQQGGEESYAGGGEYDEVPASTRDRGPAGTDVGDAMTRSEERLRVGTENVAAGRARLRKYVVTENVTTSVPVSHEELRVEREPITEANRDAALSGADITEGEHEVTLHAERPVVAKETVPVERVRMGTETVTEQQQVSEQVRKERIDDPDLDDARGADR